MWSLVQDGGIYKQKEVFVASRRSSFLVPIALEASLSRCYSGFGSPADLDLRRFKSASGYGPPLADLDPPTKLIFLLYEFITRLSDVFFSFLGNISFLATL